MYIISSKSAVLKGQSNEIFDLIYFHNSNLPGPQTNGLNKIEFWLGIRSYSKFLLSPGYVTRPRRVNLPGI